MEKIRNQAVILAISLSAAIFVIDLFTPLGDAIWVCYTIPLLIVSSQPRKHRLLLITALSWVLIILGHFFSPMGPNPALDALYRCVGMIVQLVVALVLIQRNRMWEELQKRRNELEQEVTERRVVEKELRKSQEALFNTLAKERQLQEHVRQTQKMEAIGTLAGGIAHDFNNILAAIIGFSEMALDDAETHSPLGRHLQQVLKAGIRGRDLVRQILAFSRKSDQEKKPVKVSDVAKESLELLRASLPSTIGIRFNVTSESSPVMADPVQIQQVIINICTNAAHAMRNNNGAAITITLSDFGLLREESAPEPAMEPGQYLRLTISDTGEGMASEVMQRIFDPFFTTKKPGEGTGLGLSVVHGIVESHGGTITVESEPGKGSTFTIYLPRLVEDHPETSGIDHIPVGGHERILFVDDEKPIVQMGEEALRSLGYGIVSRTSSREALALFRDDPRGFDLVITDQTMPDITGVDLAREILAIRPDMPVILCTGFSHLVDADSAKQAGVRAFAMKPLTKSEIARTIRKVLDE